jgi:hypothetical protein
MIGSDPLFVCFVTTIRASEFSDWGIHLVAGLGSQFRGSSHPPLTGLDVLAGAQEFPFNNWSR